MVKLFGINHGGIIYLPLYNETKDIIVEPSDLLHKLYYYKPETSIGVELCQGDYQEDLSNDSILKEGEAKFRVKLTHSIGWVNYWSRILEFCKQKGFDIIYLDSYDLVKQYNENKIRVDLIEEKLRLMKDEIEADLKSRFALETEIYKERVKMHYTMFLKRSKYLLKMIEETLPDAAIIGLAHCPYLLDQKPEMFEAFSSERVLMPYTLGEWEKIVGIDEMKDGMDEKEYNTYLGEDMYSEKRFLQLKEVERKNADYTGTWMPKGREGVFFMYIENRTKQKNSEEIGGKIIDWCGEAIFSGQIEGDYIKFVKQYDIDAISTGNGERDEIIYKGKKVNDIIKGKYFFRRIGDSYTKDFIMIEGDPKQWKLPENILHV